MIRGRNNNVVNLLVHLVEHHTLVIKEWLIGALFFHILSTEIAVHITKSYKIFIFTALFIRLPCNPAHGSNKSNIYFPVGGCAGLANCKSGK